MDVIENERFVNEQNNGNAESVFRSSVGPISSQTSGKLATPKTNSSSQPQSNMINLEKNLKIIEEMDESSSIAGERKISPSSVADAVKMTGDLMKNFSQINTILSNQLSSGGVGTNSSPQFGDVIESSSSSSETAERTAVAAGSTLADVAAASTSSDAGEILIDNIIEPSNEPSTQTSTLTATSSGATPVNDPAAATGSTTSAGGPKDIIQIQVMKKLNEISQLSNVVTPLQHINSLFSNLANNANVSFNALTTSSSSLNKKLAHFQKQTAASLGASLSMMNSTSDSRFSAEFGGGAGSGGGGGSGSSGKLATSFSYDLRLDMSFYQTLENYLFVK